MVAVIHKNNLRQNFNCLKSGYSIPAFKVVRAITD